MNPTLHSREIGLKKKIFHSSQPKRETTIPGCQYEYSKPENSYTKVIIETALRTSRIPEED